MTDTPPMALAVAERVSELVKHQHVTLAQLGAAMGVARTQVSRRLNGHTEFKLSELDAIAPLLLTSAATLINPERRPAINLDELRIARLNLERSTDFDAVKAIAHRALTLLEQQLIDARTEG